MLKVNGLYWDFFNKNKDKTLLILCGGAGAGKTYAIIQWLIKLSLERPHMWTLVVRKTQRSTKDSVIPLFIENLRDMNLKYMFRRSENRILIGQSDILFRGLDDPDKIKSSEYNIIWLEEATEFSNEEYHFLSMRLRRRNPYGRNQKILSFNPEYVDWLVELVNNMDEDTAMIKTSYKDNPFVSKDYAIQLESLRDYSEELYKIYAKGEFAIPQNLIFTNWDIVSNIPDRFDSVAVGVDFGYNNPTAFVRIGIIGKDLYVLDEFYRTKLTNSEVALELKKFVKAINVINVYADPAEPARIEELQRNGIRVYPAMSRDVCQGIDMLKRYRIHVRSNCANIIRELKTYSWKKKGDLVLDEPIKFNDHAIDALRYAVVSITSRSDASIGKHVINTSY